MINTIDDKNNETQLNTISEEKMNNQNRFKAFMIKHYNTILDFIIIILIILIIRTYVVSPFKVSGGSMADTLHDGDIMFVEKITYHFWEPKRGDIVVVRPPHNTEVYFVKRIIGIPGDKISFDNGKIYLINNEYPDGILINEQYLNATNYNKTFLPTNQNGVIEVQPNHYFVMGDNRNYSTDSRAWGYANFSPYGTIPKENIVGKSILVFFPFPHLVARENYFLSGGVLFSSPYYFNF